MSVLTLPKWYDLHTHLRQDELLPVTIEHHLAAQCAGVLAMPNTKPPVATVFSSEASDCWSIEHYREKILKAGGDRFDTLITPLYLTAKTTSQMIHEGAEAGLLQACKYYPPHGTTNAEYGRALEHFIENVVFQAMAEQGVILCIHGEEHEVKDDDYFDRQHNAETLFYQNSMPKLVEQVQDLKIICEHITTKTAVEFVKRSDSRVTASITPQHLIYTIGSLVRKLNYHLYCLPVVKFSEDRQALRDAVLNPQNQKFFAGTDSAPHTTKAFKCKCAAGCYTAPIAPQLYAQAFELAGANLDQPEAQQTFRKFLCEIGPKFYGLPIPKETFTLVRENQAIDAFETPVGLLQPLPLGDQPDQTQLTWRIKG